MLITPRISEKSYKLTVGNIYVFDVPVSANKAEVIAAIKAQYPDVKIADVRLMITKGKAKAVNRGKRSRPGVATRKDVKKAYVTVREGKIEIAAFNEVANQMQSEPTKETKVESKVKAGAETKKAGLLTRRRTGNRGDK
ncbi:50S ribosomal protein L23 [Candidatus Saccharibacteria bacterium]|nr:50S ribosomal protein L23 [Candidatus Saccharibacteria bacterium]MCL1962686.1 50S ribosomal protein L23 [Candidatus Saccharibacteria bacterium]